VRGKNHEARRYGIFSTLMLLYISPQISYEAKESLIKRLREHPKNHLPVLHNGLYLHI